MRLDERDLLTAFAALHPISGCVLVHSSLSSCGYIAGGAETVVGALRSWLEKRLLVMPTHTYCYPDRTDGPPVFDNRATPSLVGAVTDYFWRQPCVVRSQHPTHSLAALGPASEELCAGHEHCDTPCGRGTPYERLVKEDASVLMFGVCLNSYTLFHTAEDAAAVPYLYEAVPYSLLRREADRQVHSMRMWRQDMNFPRRFGVMDQWLEERSLLVRRRLGWGEVLWIPSSQAVHQCVVEQLRMNPYFLAEKSV